MPPFMHPRRHPLLVSAEEARANPDLVFSDHLPILLRLPLPNQSSLTIISLNILGPNGLSGLHKIRNGETDIEQTEKRYTKIATGLSKAIEKHGAEVLLLQEGTEHILAFLQKGLGNNWAIILDERVGLISCYSKNRLSLKNSFLDEAHRIRTLNFIDRTADAISIQLSNVWGIFDPFPQHLERRYKALLSQSESTVTALIGDTNSRIAPIDDKPRNITTSILPMMMNTHHNIDGNIQVTDHPDGGFYCIKDGNIYQLEHEILDFKTADPIEDTRNAEELKSWPEYRMILCLDKRLKQRVVINQRTICDYQKNLRQIFQEPELVVRLASDSFNHKALAIRFPYNSAVYEYVKGQLGGDKEIQFNIIQSTSYFDGGRPFSCVFIPLEKTEILHQTLSDASRYPILSTLDEEIKLLSKKRWYFRKVPEKIAVLQELRDSIRTAPLDTSPANFLQIILDWEEKKTTLIDKKYQKINGQLTNNRKMLALHRNIFLAPIRPKKPTRSEEILEAIKSYLCDEMNQNSPA